MFVVGCLQLLKYVKKRLMFKTPKSRFATWAIQNVVINNRIRNTVSKLSSLSFELISARFTIDN